MFYVGQTGDKGQRLEQHSIHYFQGSFTKRAKDWKLLLVIDCNSRGQAVRIEKHIKAMKSTIYIKSLTRYPEMVERLKKRFE